MPRCQNQMSVREILRISLIEGRLVSNVVGPTGEAGIAPPPHAPPCPAPSHRPSLLEKAGLAQAVGHMPTGYWVGVTVQIPAGRFFAVPWQGAHFGQCVFGLFVTPELGIARDQDQRAVRVRPGAAG